MYSSDGVRQVIEVLHHGAPFLILFYYLLTTVISVCTLQTLDVDPQKTPHRTVFAVSSLVTLTYVSEAAIIFSQLFANDDILATKDSNVYALSSILVWFILSATIGRSKTHPWYPYYGSWAIALAVEAVILVLYLQHFRPLSVLATVQLSLQGTRILLLAFLPAVLFGLLQLSHRSGGSDEENTPLLAQTVGDTDITVHSSKYGSVDDNGNAEADSTCAAGDSSETSVVPDEGAEEANKRAKNLARLQNRLKETGNWFTYAKGFLVFFPHVWPKNQPRLQLTMAAVGLCLGCVRVLNILTARQLGLVINAMSDSKTASNPFYQLGIYVLLYWLDSYAGIRALRQWLWMPVRAYASLSLDTASFNHIMGLSCDFHDDKQSGELYKAMEQGKSVIELLEMLLYQIVPVSADLVIACVYFYFLFDAYMVLIAGCTIVFYMWTSMLFTGRESALRRETVLASRKKSQVMYDTMGGWKTVSYFNRMKHAKELYSNSASRCTQSRLSSDLYFYFTYGLKTLFLDWGLFAALFFAAYQVTYNGKSIGTFVTLFTVWGNLSGPLWELTNVYRNMLNDLIDAEQLLELFNTKPAVRDGLRKMRLADGRVDFQRVDFTYNGKKQTLHDLSFHVEPGQKIALIGETGGGKSTILKLIFRFYDVSDGAVLVDGQDIRQVTLDTLRESIGVVPQDPSLFNDTILTNLRFARLNATDEEIHEACKAAAIHDKILSFTDGYLTKVGEHGVKLSGGELQRIAIARAILKDPKIILLDEATSSVDSETEEKIQRALGVLCKGRTTFVVAHRLSTVMDADLMIVIKDGEILEQGPPAELLKSRGKYYSLWTKQMGLSNGAPDLQAENELLRKAYDEAQETIKQLQCQKGDMEEAKDSEARKEIFNLNADTPKQRDLFSALGRRIFRPDAPDFVPKYQQGTVASEGKDDRRQHDASAHGSSHESSSNKTAAKEAKVHFGKRKDKSEDQVFTKKSLQNIGLPAEPALAAQTDNKDSGNKSDSKSKPNKRPNKRHQSKSEPGQSVQQSQGDGASEADMVPMGSTDGRPMDNTFRRVTAPSDPPSAPMVGGSTANGRHKRRHWRDKKSRDGSGTSGGSDNPSSGSAPNGWSGSSSLSGTPTAHFTSPADGTTPANELAGASSANKVQFAPGS